MCTRGSHKLGDVFREDSLSGFHSVSSVMAIGEVRKFSWRQICRTREETAALLRALT